MASTKYNSIAMLSIVSAQIFLLIWAIRATNIMKAEWPHVVKASPAQVYVIEQPQFWGPVNAIVPKRCHEIRKWQAMTSGRAHAAEDHQTDGVAIAQSDGVAIISSTPSYQTVVSMQPPAATTSSTPTIVSTQPPPSTSNALVSNSVSTQPAPTTLVSTQPLSASSSSSPQQLMVQQLTLSTTAPGFTTTPGFLEDALRVDRVTQQALAAGVVDVPNEELLRSEGGTAGRRLADHILVTRCNETMQFKEVGHMHRYFAMISLSNHISGGTPTAEELHIARIRSQELLVYGIVICMILKYSLKATDIVAELFGHHYVQIWNQGRTTFDKALESLLLHGISIVFTLAMQMTLCGLFLTFWREDHFIMTYVPGCGFAMFFGGLVVFCIAMVIDRLWGFMARCGNWYIYSFWVIWGFWMLLMAVPMIGCCVYSVNFMWRVNEMGWLQDEHHMFSPAFVLASNNLAKVTGMFVFVAVADMLMILMLDYESQSAH